MKYYIEYSEQEKNEVDEITFLDQCFITFGIYGRIAKIYDENCVTLILW
jgi:hypothetical protein